MTYVSEWLSKCPGGEPSVEGGKKKAEEESEIGAKVVQRLAFERVEREKRKRIIQR